MHGTSRRPTTYAGRDACMPGTKEVNEDATRSFILFVRFAQSLRRFFQMVRFVHLQ